jgi:hypothetical protein
MDSKIKRFLKEPLLHFLLIGFIIFFSSYYISKQRDAHTIVIDKAVMAKLTMAWQTQFGQQPTSKELQIAADEYVKQEVLAREAVQLGLNQDDEIIKRRLQQKMEFILKDNIVVPEPGETALKSYFEKNTAKFTEPPKVSFSHIYFSADKVGNEEAKKKAMTALQMLKGQPSLQRAPELGDRFMLLYDYNNIDKKEGVGLFGSSAFTDSLFTVKENNWAGPFLSGYGLHLLYVNKRQGNVVPPFNQIKARVIEAYKNDKLKEMDNEAMEKLVEKYTVKLKLD